MRRVKDKITTDNEFNHLKSQFAILKGSEILRFKNGTSSGYGVRRYMPYAFTEQGNSQEIEKSQQAVDQILSQTHLRSEKPITKQAAAQFEPKVRQQAVAQLIQIPCGQNITKNLPDEFRSSLPSIEEIEAELSGVEESQ